MSAHIHVHSCSTRFMGREGSLGVQSLDNIWITYGENFKNFVNQPTGIWNNIWQSAC